MVREYGQLEPSRDTLPRFASRWIARLEPRFSRSYDHAAEKPSNVSSFGETRTVVTELLFIFEILDRVMERAPIHEPIKLEVSSRALRDTKFLAWVTTELCRILKVASTRGTRTANEFDKRLDFRRKFPPMRYRDLYAFDVAFPEFYVCFFPRFNGEIPTVLERNDDDNYRCASNGSMRHVSKFRRTGCGVLSTVNGRVSINERNRAATASNGRRT